jgi:hypothetical protein
MHRLMSLSTIMMNAAGVVVAVLFAMAAAAMPDFAARSGAIYVAVLILATFASERIRQHVIHDDRSNSPDCCEGAMKVSRVLLICAWVGMVGMLTYLGVSQV